MKIEPFFDLQIATLDSPDEVIDEKGIDVIDIEGKHEGLGYIRPRKVIWQFNKDLLEDPSDIYSFVRSSKLKKLLKKWNQALSQHDIEIKVKDPLSQESFFAWYQIYRSTLSKKDHGRIAMADTWLDDKTQKGQYVIGVFLYKNGYLLGGNICTLLSNKLSIAYGLISEKFSSGINWGAILDFKTIEYGVQKERNIVSFGQDTNLYGYHLSPGLLSYKSRFGLLPKPQEKKGWVTTKFVSTEKFSDTVFFFSEKNGEFILTCLYKYEKPEGKEFLSRGTNRIDFIKI